MTTPTFCSGLAIPLKTCLNTTIVLATQPTQKGHWPLLQLRYLPPPSFAAVPSLQRKVSPLMFHELTEIQTPLQPTEKRRKKVEQTVTQTTTTHCLNISRTIQRNSPDTKRGNKTRHQLCRQEIKTQKTPLQTTFPLPIGVETHFD